MGERAVLPVLLRGLGDAWQRPANRLAGLADEEHRWSRPGRQVAGDRR